jgi:CDP-diacylglycerol---serine O-phosphatidyltransferase
MLLHLLDRANAITATGIALSTLAIFLALSGQLSFSIALGLWAMLADQVDGIVARRARNRNPLTAAIGKNLDGLGDILYGAILPAVIIITASQSWTAAVLTIAMVVAGSLRLSYFSAVGLADGRFHGLPLSYDMPVLATIFLLRPWLTEELFAVVLIGSFSIIGILHVAPIKIRAPTGAAYLAITGAVAILSILTLSLAG